MTRSSAEPPGFSWYGTRLSRGLLRPADSANRQQSRRAETPVRAQLTQSRPPSSGRPERRLGALLSRAQDVVDFVAPPPQSGRQPTGLYFHASAPSPRTHYSAASLRPANRPCWSASALANLTLITGSGSLGRRAAARRSADGDRWTCALKASGRPWRNCGGSPLLPAAGSAAPRPETELPDGVPAH